MTKMERAILMNKGFLAGAARIRIFESKIIKESGLNITPREMTYIVYINEQKNAEPRKIFKHLGVTKGTFSNAVKTLIKKKFVDKHKTSKDQRAINLTLTSKGKQAYKVHLKVRKIIQNRLAKILTTKELDTFIAIGTKLWEGTNDIISEK